MIVFSLSVTVPLSRHADLVRSIGGLLEPTRVIPGCFTCRLYQDSENPSTFMLIEEWATQVALDRHLASDAGKILVAAMELSTQPPRVHFDSVSQRAGIEVIEAARVELGSR